MFFDELFKNVHGFVIISYIYMVLTVGIVWKMYRIYYSNRTFIKSIVVHRCLFRTFIWMELSNLYFFVFDNIVFRLPSTGFFTNFCDSIAPSHFIKLLYMLQLSSNYSCIFYSFLFCLTRLIMVYCGENHEKICKRLFRLFIPFTFIFPCFADFYMIPSQGGCRRLKPPYPPDAISLSFGETLFNIRTDNIMLGLSFITPVVILIMNSVLVYKVRKILFKRKVNTSTSKRNRKAQLSLTMTTLAIMIQHFASGGKTIVGIIDTDYQPYALFIRHRFIDLGMVSVPWLFYLSHPMFHDKLGRISSIT